MPIKFRCVHCGQYLGISQSKAGTVVDCPTCGRSVGVPQKDGQAERVEQPSLNHADSQLADALREVAAIAQSSEMALPQPPPMFERASDGRETREVHAPPPKVIQSKPLPPVQRLEPPLPPKVSPSPGEEFSGDSSDEETLDARLPLEQLASLAEMESPEKSPAPSSPAQFPWTNEVPWKLWLAFVAVGFTAIVTGFLLGRWDRAIQPAKPPANAEADEQPSPASKPLATFHADVMAELGQVAAQGTVTYSEQGQGSAIKPDAGAWIYAFPIPPPGRVQIPPAWFQSETSQAIAALQVLGGNATQADENGNFELRLLHQGSYLVLICSEHKTPNPTAPPKTHPEILEQYFQNPGTFLSDRDFQWQELDYRGQVTDLDLDPL